jgi:hypothetical protein
MQQNDKHRLYIIKFWDGDVSPKQISSSGIHSQKDYHRLVSQKLIPRDDPPTSIKKKRPPPMPELNSKKKAPAATAPFKDDEMNGYASLQDSSEDDEEEASPLKLKRKRKPPAIVTREQKRKVRKCSSDPDGLFADDAPDPDGLFADDASGPGSSSDPDGLFDEDGAEVELALENYQLPTAAGGIFYPPVLGGKKKAKIVDVPLVEISKAGPTKVVSLSHEDHFLRWRWGDRIHTREETLSKIGPDGLPRLLDEGGFKYSLMALKTIEKKGKFKMQKMFFAKAFYFTTSGPGLEKLDIYNELNRIAYWDGLSPRLIVARLELLVSPSCHLSNGQPCQFLRPNLEFEIIPDNHNMGCGFIPERLLETWMGNGEEAKATLAVQVRIVAPTLGIFKGVLMRKRNITKVQLPRSMLKVEASKLYRKSFDGVYVLFNGTFPSKTCAMVDRAINPNNTCEPTKSSEKDLNPIDKTPAAILAHLGVPDDLLATYNDESVRWGYGRKNHAYELGVADPTDALPEGTVFVTGLGVGAVLQKKVFITRQPCAEQSDGLILKRVSKKPKKMSHDDWDFLCGMQFGLVIFATPQNPATKPIPGMISKGDLDGDHYLVVWDSEILAHVNPSNPLTPASSSYLVPEDEDSLLNTEFTTAAEGEQDYIQEITGHRGGSKSIEVQTLWAGGFQNWQWLRILINEIPEDLVEYALQHNLQEEPGWEWVQKRLRDSEIIEIIGHRKGERGAEVNVRYHGEGKTSWNRVGRLKPDEDSSDVDNVLAVYAETNKLLNWKDFQWVKKYMKKAREAWFTKTQLLLSNAQRYGEHARLTQHLHCLYGKWSITYGLDDPTVGMLARAYKNSNDLFKHGGKVVLPIHLRNSVYSTLAKYVDWKV